MSSKFHDITGKRFCRLVVVSNDGKSNFRDTYWICKCDCGNVKRVLGSHLKGSKIRSCGCLVRNKRGKVKDLLTREFLEEYYVKQNKYLCDIRQEFGISNASIYKYLKIYNIDIRKGRKINRLGDLHLSDFVSLIKSAKERQLDFDLTPDYLYKLYIQQNKKCAITGIDIVLDYSKSNGSYIEKTASLDRIDSSKGYITNNVQWVHKRINFMKGDMMLEELITWSKLIIGYNR